MTEQEWLNCIDIRAMLHHIQEGSRYSLGRTLAYPVSDRKYRLLCCAAFRLLPRELQNEPNTKAIEWQEEHELLSPPENLFPNQEVMWSGCLRNRHWKEMLTVVPPFIESNLIPNLIRDVVGNPFKPQKSLLCGICKGAGTFFVGWGHGWQPCSCTGGKTEEGFWMTGQIWSMAQQIYEHRDWGLLPILSDLCEDAGCNDAITSHLRDTTTQHVRGCWALDLMLGKE